MTNFAEIRGRILRMNEKELRLTLILLSIECAVHYLNSFHKKRK